MPPRKVGLNIMAPLSPRCSFSVISSEEASELEWFDPEVILSTAGTAGLVSSPRSTNVS